MPTHQSPDVLTLRNTPAACDRVSLLGPNLPEEAGHFVATVLTPSQYPFAVENIAYSVLRNSDVPSCTVILSHRVLLFAVDSAQGPPAMPAASGLGYREYQVPASPTELLGRQIDITVPIPLILSEGQSAVVAIQLAAENDAHICVAHCLTAEPRAGVDWWSNRDDTPFDWQDLVADYGFSSHVMTTLRGTLLR